MLKQPGPSLHPYQIASCVASRNSGSVTATGVSTISLTVRRSPTADRISSGNALTGTSRRTPGSEFIASLQPSDAEETQRYRREDGSSTPVVLDDGRTHKPALDVDRDAVTLVVESQKLAVAKVDVREDIRRWVI